SILTTGAIVTTSGPDRTVRVNSPPPWALSVHGDHSLSSFKFRPAVALRAELTHQRAGHPGRVAGGQEVQQGTAQQSQGHGALGPGGCGAPEPGWLGGGEKIEPVGHRPLREVAPRPGRVDQRTGVALDPENEEVAPVGIRQPAPECGDDSGQVGVRVVAAEVVQELQLVLASPGQEFLEESVLGPEEEEQYTG